MMIWKSPQKITKLTKIYTQTLVHLLHNNNLVNLDQIPVIWKIFPLIYCLQSLEHVNWLSILPLTDQWTIKFKKTGKV